MRRRTASGLARFLAVVTAVGALSASAAAAPPVRLHVANDSTCEGSQSLAGRLPGRGIVVAADGADGVDVDVRARPSESGAEAELVIRSTTGTATRTLRAPTCDEVLDALVFTLGLALEQPIEATPPTPTPPPAVVEPPPPPPAPREATPPPPPPGPALAWGGGAGAGVFAGASRSAAPAIVVHAELESRAAVLFAPSAVLGATFVLPSSATVAGVDVASALQAGTLDGCPLRLGTPRLALRPCLELQVGRLETRSAGFAGARLASSTWVALAAALRGRAELGAGIALEIAVAGGSPLIQDTFTVGDQRVLEAGPLLFSAIAGLGVHFP